MFASGGIMQFEVEIRLENGEVVLEIKAETPEQTKVLEKISSSIMGSISLRKDRVAAWTITDQQRKSLEMTFY